MQPGAQIKTETADGVSFAHPNRPGGTRTPDQSAEEFTTLWNRVCEQIRCSASEPVEPMVMNLPKNN
jgi:hypothetical protein